MRSLSLLAWIGLTSLAAAQHPVGNQPVHLSFLVPDDAQVWVEGAATTTRGPVREFVSPAIPSGQNYVYTVRVRWQREGQTVDEKRDVEVKAGDFVRLNYRGAGNSYVSTPVLGYGQQAFYYTPEGSPAYYYNPTEEFYLGSPSGRWSYYGDTPGWGTADTTGAGG
jgi:uncharacterized protein (TIGR03000 family)